MTALAPSSPIAHKTRVMIVDDSVVVRGLVSRWLGEEPGFEVVATATDGRKALEQLTRAQPDIVLLDLEMPDMDGITTLPEILKLRPQTAVIVVSSLTRRNADISLKCLSLGAVDYLPKPESHREVTTSTGFRHDLVSKLQAIGASRKLTHPAAKPAATQSPVSSPAGSGSYSLRARPMISPQPRCLLVGSSTGGPRAVGQVLSGMTQALTRLPVLIVQHMPPVFTSVFAEHLRAQTGLPAHEGIEGEVLKAGQIYVAPGGRHMGLAKDGNTISIRLDDTPPVNFCRPAVDVLFRDAAQIFGNSILSVILTGMGSDGTVGARAIVEAGGLVYAQDEASSTVWGMPGSVVKAGYAHHIASLDDMAGALKSVITGNAR
jgi:two-component system, chemotaxis family, protein-glutamate methylesterase/glutaminase